MKWSSVRALKPAWLILVPAGTSFVVWIVPWPGMRRGFYEPEPLTLSGALVLIAWYGSLALAANVGWLAGRQIRPANRLDAADDDRVYKMFSVLGAVGVIGMYSLVEIRQPGLLWTALTERQFNLVREAVPMAPGIATLRYATVVAGAIALYRRLVLRQRHWLHVTNLGLLVATVMMASRLSLMMALLLALGLLVSRGGGQGWKLKQRYWLLIFAGVFAILTLANYIRNANFYAANYGSTNAVSMMMSEAVTYIGAPFQVSLAAATAPPRILDAQGPRTLFEGIGELVVPSFLSGADSAVGTSWYAGYVSIERSLTTNSALAAAVGALSEMALPVCAILCLAAGFVMGHASRYNSYFVLVTYVVGYCFLELWRLLLFNEGIIWFLALSLILCTAIAGPAPRRTSPQLSRA